MENSQDWVAKKAEEEKKAAAMRRKNKKQGGMNLPVARHVTPWCPSAGARDVIERRKVGSLLESHPPERQALLNSVEMLVGAKLSTHTSWLQEQHAKARH
jgi:hypothetical protein